MVRKLKLDPKIRLQSKDKGHFYVIVNYQTNITKLVSRFKTGSIIDRGARSTRIKSAVPKVLEMIDLIHKTLNEQRVLIKLDSANRDFLSAKEVIPAEIENSLQKATFKSIGNVAPYQRKMGSQPDGLEDNRTTVTQEYENTAATVRIYYERII